MTINIKLIKQGAKIWHTEYNQVLLPLMLDVELTPVSEYIQSQKYQSGHLENDGFIAVSFESDRSINVFKFEKFLKHISGNLFWAKGIPYLDDIEFRYIFQMSGNRYTLEVDETCLKQKKIS